MVTDSNRSRATLFELMRSKRFRAMSSEEKRDVLVLARLELGKLFEETSADVAIPAPLESSGTAEQREGPTK